MPTPFTHLEVAQQLLADELIPAETRAGLQAELSAFLLGNIAADARVSSGLKREDTHFYAYGQTISEPPWRTMLHAYPTLTRAFNPAQRTFLAGYVAHLSMDELWTRRMTDPYFAHGAWADQHERFVMLHALLVTVDERDYACLCPWQRDALLAAQPARPTVRTASDTEGSSTLTRFRHSEQADGWLPFMTADDLIAWRDLVGRQLPPGRSETLAILGGRIGMTPDALQAIVDSPEQMTRRLWDHIPLETLAEVEAEMYAYARGQMLAYLGET